MHNKIYAERDLMALDEAGNHYIRHVDHMTREGLHSKSDIAAELGWRDMQIAALQQKLDALLTEYVAIKAGPQGFFAYGSDCGYEEFDTADKAREYAEESISDYRGEACDGWSDEVGSVVWGIVMQRATMTGLRPVTEADNCDSHIKEWCDYTLLPELGNYFFADQLCVSTGKDAGHE